MMEETTKYTLEGAVSLMVSVIAYKVWRLRCDSSSKCCGDAVEIDLHNGGGGNGENDIPV
jgi:hypothetical protein